MMKDIIISIQPRYVDLILSEVKIFEFRRTIPKYLTKKSILYIYESKRTKKIVGKFNCSYYKVFEKYNELWYKMAVGGGLQYKEFASYFFECKTCYGLSIDNLEIFTEPKPLSDFGIKQAPQSYCYVGEK